MILPANDVPAATAAGADAGAVVFDGVVVVVFAGVVADALVVGVAEVTLDEDGLVTSAAAATG